MKLNTIRADATLTHVALVGRLDVRGVTDIQYGFLLQVTSQPTATLVDLSELSYVASLGISMLVSAAKELERHGARMVLLRPSPLVRKTFEISGLHGLIPFADDEQAGLELLRSSVAKQATV